MLNEDNLSVQENKIASQTNHNFKDYIRTKSKDVINSLIDLNRDKDNTRHIIENLKLDVDLRGTKLWILVCAVLIASLGLNINSNPVIIGAMLISPLMGPIIGFGLGLGIYDFELIKKSLWNLGLTAMFSVVTAFLYFMATPLGDAQSEILARTNPTIFDVAIAFVGGVAGILASSSKNKGNVIPGVAIATALMPPLCTAGYGLATGNMKFFVGAIYLFTINSVFIALSTYILVKVMKFPHKEFVEKSRQSRIHRIVVFIGILILLPSIYLGYQIVKESYVKDSTYKFFKEHFETNIHTVVRQSVEKNNGRYEALVAIMGPRLDSTQIDSILNLRSTSIKDVVITVKQDLSGNTRDIDMGVTNSLEMKELYDKSQRIISSQQNEIDSLKKIVSKYNDTILLGQTIDKEIRILYPDVLYVRLIYNWEDADNSDIGNNIVIVNTSKELSKEDKLKLKDLIQYKLNTDSVDIMYNLNKSKK